MGTGGEQFARQVQDPDFLRPMLYKAINKEDELRPWITPYNMWSETHEMKTYGYLLAALHTAVRERQTTKVGEMRDAAFKRQSLGTGGLTHLALAVEEEASVNDVINAAPAPFQHKAVCMFHHIGGNCLKGKDCRFLHSPNLTAAEKSQFKTKHDEWSHRQKGKGGKANGKGSTKATAGSQSGTAASTTTGFCHTFATTGECARTKNGKTCKFEHLTAEQVKQKEWTLLTQKATANAAPTVQINDSDDDEQDQEGVTLDWREDAHANRSTIFPPASSWDLCEVVYDDKGRVFPPTT